MNVILKVFRSGWIRLILFLAYVILCVIPYTPEQMKKFDERIREGIKKTDLITNLK